MWHCPAGKILNYVTEKILNGLRKFKYPANIRKIWLITWLRAWANTGVKIFLKGSHEIELAIGGKDGQN
jgi:hypothetical protein